MDTKTNIRTPKEKANDLYIDMKNIMYEEFDADFNARKCALIAVAELIKVTTLDPYNRHNSQKPETMSYMDKQYWLEVQIELNKL